MGMSFSELTPKVAPPDNVEDDEETCDGSGSSNHGDEICIDSGSSSNGEEEVAWNCNSEEETVTLNAGKCALSKQPLSLELAVEPKESMQQPPRTKLSSNALVFVPGACPASVPGKKSVQAGRELLTLLKGESKDCSSELPSAKQKTPLRSKLSSKAQAFVPQGNFMQTTGFTPVTQLLPTLLIPMCTRDDGFDDSPRATPRATYPDAQQDMTNAPDLSIHQEHPTGSNQQSVESQEVVSKPPPKICWADLHEEEDDDFSNDLWFGDLAPNDLLRLS